MAAWVGSPPITALLDDFGFDRTRSPYESPHRATELLQEIRSTILWLREIALLLDQRSTA